MGMLNEATALTPIRVDVVRALRAYRDEIQRARIVRGQVVEVQRDPAQRRHAPPVVRNGKNEELIPGFKSLVGNIFTRPKKSEPIPKVVEPPESSSIADRHGGIGSAEQFLLENHPPHA